jgi:hypothetical protein
VEDRAQNDSEFMDDPIAFLRFFQKLTPPLRVQFVEALRNRDLGALEHDFGIDIKATPELAKSLKEKAEKLSGAYPGLFDSDKRRRA